jgi:hypothetical protein
MHVTAEGRVVTRLVPVGRESVAADSGASIVGAFPETVGVNFRPNRGFEGIAISLDGRTLYTALQSPMEYRLRVLNDNDFGLVVPILQQLDVLAAPAICTPA